MKKTIIIAYCLLMLGSYSCKTSEKNYRAAYESAVKADTGGLDDLTLNKINEEKLGKKIGIGNDSVRVKSEYVRIVDNSAPELMNYGVVVGQFKQIFNARKFHKRLLDTGFKPVILANRDEEYLVIAKNCATLEEAATYVGNIKKNIPFPLPIEAWILQPVK